MVLCRRARGIPARRDWRRRDAARRAVLRQHCPATMRRSTGRWPGTTEGGPAVTESYVNLIPTPQGGTHVNGLRTGLTNAMREFCDFRNLLPRGVQHRAGRCLGRPEFRAEHQAGGSAVLRADQGAAVVARVGGVCRRRHQGQFRAVAEPASGDRRPDCAACDRQGAADA